MYKSILHFLLLYVFLISGCKNNTTPTMNTTNEASFTLPEWAKDANIYEVNIRQYTPEGTFKAFQKHLPRLQEMGVSILWFMPIYPISTTKKKGSLGSYYAVSDFKNTNPAFGTPEDFKAIVDEAHALGMKVILDWVPNHTGWDHVWMKTNPDFYTKNSKGEIIDPLNEHGESMGWTDVADLNYDNRQLWDSMKNDMLYWVNNFDVDGFRQDMAMLVPLEFWKATNKALLDVNPNLFLLAESEEKDHVNQECFHACYGWSFHHLINDVAKNKKNAKDLDHWRANDFGKVTKGLYMHFVTNHDENSWSGSEYERMGEAYKTMAALTYVYDGIPLTYSGQEEPLLNRLKFFEKDTIPFGKFENKTFYTTLNRLKKENKALWNAPYGGGLQRIMPHDHVYAFSRTKDEQTVIFIGNMSNQYQKAICDLDYTGTDVFTGHETRLVKGQEFSLRPWQFFILLPKK
jgi:glycosidase